ncbi:MAG: hypothetical protein DME19_08870 [Verrucomicrobia bacterium]|nr:MAG: hypothetical protein DME19_08870 [Verrucomicrobiota bacterium]
MIASPETLEVESESKREPADPERVPNRERKPIKQADLDAADENLYLIGRPTLKQFLRFVRSHAVNAPDEGTLTDEWQAAHDFARTLEKEEAGAADNPPITKLEVNSKNEALLTEFLEDPLVRNGFNTVPTEVAFVELDRLVVYQHHIDLTYVRLLERELGRSPSEEQIFRTSLLHDHPQPPVKWSRVHGNKFVFVSPSNDMRFLGAMKLQRDNIADYPPPGNLAGVIGLAVGFGSNFLNAIYVENRLILNNGSHRAYALRKMGVTHVPCIVQHVSSREKLDVVAASEVVDKPDYYLKHPRPSMLRDYFNPKLHKVMAVHRQLRQITVKFDVESTYIPAL